MLTDENETLLKEKCRMFKRLNNIVMLIYNDIKKTNTITHKLEKDIRASGQVRTRIVPSVRHYTH